MGMSRRRTMRQRANDAVRGAAQRIDDQTGQAAQRAARTLAITVGVLRIPTFVIGVIPVPFIAAILMLGLAGDGAGRVITICVAAIMAVICVMFFWRRERILRAVEDPDQLATELAIMAELASKTQDTRGVLLQISGESGFRLFSRMRGLWSRGKLGERWIRAIGDLPRAKWFGPPRIGTTVALAMAQLWLIPASLIACLFALIAAVSGSL